MTWERVFIRAQVVVVAGLLLTGMAWGPKAVVAAVLGAGAPLAGEVVPRQIPYRGYLEQNGVAVNSPGVAMRFRLFGIDGGVLHEESRTAVPVQNGQFSVELGDSTAIPKTVFQQNFLELEVAVGAAPTVLDGRQRILTVAYASSSAQSADTMLYRGNEITDSLVPAGTVVAFGGSTPPSGWLLCDGSSLLRASYPRLFAAIGASHGQVDGSSFNVPDLRGRFVRGVDGNAGRDPDAAARAVPAVGGNSGDSVGSVQSDELRSHTHRSRGGATTAPTSCTNCVTLQIAREDYQPSFDATYAGGAETRPTNLALNWIIKY